MFGLSRCLDDLTAVGIRTGKKYIALHPENANKAQNTIRDKIMQQQPYLDTLINTGQFYFRHLKITGIDNEPMVKIFSASILEQEICLFAQNVTTGDEYCSLIHQKLTAAMANGQPFPVVRFADGEYAFYKPSLKCNGLYKQAESISAIRQVIPLHVEAIAYVALRGLLAPLVFPGNSHRKASGFFSFFRKKPDTGATDFLDLLKKNNIRLTVENYLPFYALYAYLTSDLFAATMNGKKICILNSEYNQKSFHEWFSRRSSYPVLNHVSVPAEYVATKWADVREEVLAEIPPDTDLCLVGAGVGALLICADTARELSVPALDAGHVINMMNDQVHKSGAIRLFTLRKPS